MSRSTRRVSTRNGKKSPYKASIGKRKAKNHNIRRKLIEGDVLVLIKDIDTFDTTGDETIVSRVVAKSVVINTCYGKVLNVLLGDNNNSHSIIQLVLKGDTKYHLKNIKRINIITGP